MPKERNARQVITPDPPPCIQPNYLPELLRATTKRTLVVPEPKRPASKRESLFIPTLSKCKVLYYRYFTLIPRCAIAGRLLVHSLMR